MNQMIYVFGGKDGQLLTTLEFVDPISGAWQTVSPMPAPLERAFSVAALGGSKRMYVIGWDPTQVFCPAKEYFSAT